jgi:hypothetical protein
LPPNHPIPSNHHSVNILPSQTLSAQVYRHLRTTFQPPILSAQVYRHLRTTFQHSILSIQIHRHIRIIFSLDALPILTYRQTPRIHLHPILSILSYRRAFIEAISIATLKTYNSSFVWRSSGSEIIVLFGPYAMIHRVHGA